VTEDRQADPAGSDLREEVRSRYAAAARAVLSAESGASAGCCGSSASSCCGPGSAAADSAAPDPAALDSADCFGGPLYGAGETGGLPREAVAGGAIGTVLAVIIHPGQRREVRAREAAPLAG
jgi:arsenite methyltransferase